jgi:hypothetical protein
MRHHRGHVLRRRYGRAQNTEVTPVVFRAWLKSQGGGVIALFPTVPGSADQRECQSFEHVGQHGSADCTGIFYSTTRAKPAEYARLMHELESPPYNYRLKVYARIVPWMEKARQEARDRRMVTATRHE